MLVERLPKEFERLCLFQGSTDEERSTWRRGGVLAPVSIVDLCALVGEVDGDDDVHGESLDLRERVGLRAGVGSASC